MKARLAKEPESLQVEGMKVIISCNSIDIWTKIEVLRGLKLSNHAVTLTEESNLINELYQRGEIQSEQKYRNPLHNFLSFVWKN